MVLPSSSVTSSPNDQGKEIPEKAVTVYLSTPYNTQKLKNLRSSCFLLMAVERKRVMPVL
jgi:hypothetical protein